MGSTETITRTSQIGLSDEHVGILGDAAVDSASILEANRLLQKNHDEWHMFFRDRAGHNHIAHSILTCLALGARPEEIQRAYDDGVGIQRPIPEVDSATVERLADEAFFYEALGTITQYHSFLVFFQQQMDTHGWQVVVNKYVFSRSRIAEQMLARLYEGAYHPIIHLGLGIEFQQPSIIAEALAQAAAHDDSHISQLFEACEAQAAIAYPPQHPKPLIQLLREARANETIRTAPRWEDFGNKMRDGVVGRANLEMAFIGSQFIIKPEELELQRRTAEMISVCAYMAGASQRPGRKRKIDFFYMHTLTSSIFFSVLIRQDWIKLEDRVRLVEWKGRLDLAWYVVSGSAELYEDAIRDYHDDFSANMGWNELYAAVNKEHDDGHVAKMIRALKNGQEAARPFELEFPDAFPTKGDMWLKIARMALDTTKRLADRPEVCKFHGL
ncbi:Oxidoreductase [Penicillium oxalicum]|uniref:Oxidoreductase n=1 Tax=Penicillium oxalicum TaxID=69781 RepID=UPI0020B79FD2|nr:Oxidoreductase [Penicillium oxalicum]KAI2794167.1 Oxidoreductase [Penicillium oxalicum]